jgi:4a-hydroxytetrahydrobiopterin dehydratase
MVESKQPHKLTDAEIVEALKSVPGWSVEAGKLHREFRFGNFNQAFGFMTRAALYAEVMDHHPEWSNVYAKVVVDLVTHSANGITRLDFALAQKMDAIAGQIGKRQAP